MSVFKRWNGTSWETIGPQISSARFDDTNHMIAPEYSSTNTYNVGDYVVQSDRLYKCISAIESAEEWTARHWSQVKITDEVGELKSAIQHDENVSDEFINMANVQLESGKYISNFSTGAISNNINFSLSDFIDIPEGTVSVTVNRIVINHDGSQSYPQNKMVCFYTSDETALGEGSVTINGDYVMHTITYSSAKKMRVNFPANFNPVPFIKVTKYRALRYVTFSSNDQTVDSFTETGMYLIASNYTNAPIRGAGILTVKRTQFGGIVQEYQALKASGARVFHRASDNLGVFTDWREIVNADSVGLPYSTTKTFNTKGVINIEYTIKANQRIKVELGYPRIGRINIFGSGNTSSFKTIMPFMDGIEFQNDDQDRLLGIYNPDGELGTVKLTIYPLPSEFYKQKKYIVAKNSALANYTSLTQCLLDLKDDHSDKIVEIWGGDYDIYQEYIDAGVPVYTGESPATEYFDYCVWVPENTHIIGKGIVRLKWMPTKANNPEITWQQCYAVSPLNVAATATIENVEIHCKNGRYCIHNDPLGKIEFTGAIQIYKNVKCYKYVNEVDSGGNQFGTYHTIGFGIDNAMRYEYHGCLFKNESIGRAFYGHSRNSVNASELTESESGEIILDNCICDTVGNVCVKLGNTSNSNLHIRVKFDDCYFSGLVQAVNEGTGSTVSNVFDVTYLNCGDINMQITDTNNRYPPKAYRTNLSLSN